MQKEHTAQKVLAVKLARILLNDEWHCRCLLAAAAVMQSEGITDYLLSAGFVRDAVWDALHGFAVSPSADVDLIYWGSGDMAAAKATEHRLNSALTQAFDASWEVKDQRRMHFRHSDAPYANLEEAMAVWPEQETAVGVRLSANGVWFNSFDSECQSVTHPHLPQEQLTCRLSQLSISELHIVSSWGLAPLFALTLTPTLTPSNVCNADGGIERFYGRIRAKNWQARYPKLRINC